MIPTREFLEQHYEPKEIDTLSKLRIDLRDCTAKQQFDIGRAVLAKLWTNELEYLSKTTFIINKRSKVVLLKPNHAQVAFYRQVIQKCRDEKRPIRGILLKARQLGFCVSPDSKILTTDLRWVRAGDVSRGDRIMGIDENHKGGKGASRKLRESVVEATRTVREKAFKISMSNGQTLVATGPHRFLCRQRGGSGLRWRTVEDMRPGDEIRVITEPWGESTYEDGWIGGMIDGEGSLRRKPAGGFECCISQRPGDVLNQTIKYFGDHKYSFHVEVDKRKVTSFDGKVCLRNHDVSKVVMHRLNEAFRLIGKTRPLRFVSDTSWWNGFEPPGKRSGEAHAEVVSIKPLGVRKMIDLQTSTKTFICEGFVSHNSTLIQGLQFMWCDTYSHRYSMTISYDESSTEELFQKVHLMQQKQWFSRPTKRQKAKTVEFAEPHGSVFFTRTAGNPHAGRGLTLQHLHCSELPMWPDPDSTIVAVQQALPDTLDTTNFYESTARGAVGFFYDAWHAAERGENEFIPFFAPWFWDNNYTTPFSNGNHRNGFMRGLSPDDKTYMRAYNLSEEQMHWRYLSIRNKLKGSVAQFRQEYPACSEEAFLSSGRPVFNPDTVADLKNNIRHPLWVGDILLGDVKSHSETEPLRPV